MTGSVSLTSPALNGSLQGGLSAEIWFSMTEIVVSKSTPKKNGIEYRSFPDKLAPRWTLDLNRLFVLLDN